MEEGKHPLKAQIEFTNGTEDYNIYEDPSAGNVSARFTFTMKYDVDGGETEDGITYRIKILDKEYTIVYPPTYELDKSVVGSDLNPEN